MAGLIKITKLSVAGPCALDLTFSDGSSGRWHGHDVKARDTVMTRPLTDPAYFSRAFIEGGALAWPNGLEFAPSAIYQKVKAVGKRNKEPTE